MRFARSSRVRSDGAGDTGSRDDRAQYLHQFVLHAALDAVDEQQWQGQNMNLGVVDKFNNLQVSGCPPLCHAVPNAAAHVMNLSSM